MLTPATNAYLLAFLGLAILDDTYVLECSSLMASWLIALNINTGTEQKFLPLTDISRGRNTCLVRQKSTRVEVWSHLSSRQTYSLTGIDATNL
jgi:hypothetical protein